MINAIESQQINSGIASTAELKRIQKDRHRRPADQKHRNNGKPPDSNSHQNPESESRFYAEDMQADMHLRNEIEEAFDQSRPQKNPKIEVREQGKRIDVII